MKIDVKGWGTYQGREVNRVEVAPDGEGLRAVFSNFGATLGALELVAPDGVRIPVAYPLADLRQYLQADYYPGAIIGRFANRIGGAAFTIGDQFYRLSQNGPGYSLHGGEVGFSHRVWDLKECFIHEGEAVVRFSLLSPDGDQGYPGNLRVLVTYRLSGFRLSVAYQAETDRPTHVNLTTHGYFNLSGFRQGVDQHHLKISADKVLAVDDRIVATGEMLTVLNTPFDFSQGMQIGEGMQRLGDIYNHCLVLSNPGLDTAAAEVYCLKSAIRMKIYTTQPAFQLYTPIDRPAEQHPDLPLEQVEHGKPWAFCLEPQHLPNTPNIPYFPSTLLRPGEKYSHLTVFEFERNA